MTVINRIYELVTNVSPNESIAGGLRESIPEQRPRAFPDTYFFATELTNPVEAFYLRKHPNFRMPEDLGRKLARGTQLHNLASYWFRELPNFIVDEGTVDGALMDIEGVRGRIDYLIGSSIIEFKSKNDNPETPNDVTKYYVNDLEQLVFYAIIHPQHPESNYLVFMENVYPYDLKAFKVVIRNAEGVKRLLLSRIELLRNAIETDNPSILGRCRYYELGCRFRGTDICSCADFEPLDTTALLSSISLEYDEAFTDELMKVRGGAIDEPLSCYTTYNILLPRKYHMDVVRGIETPDYSDPRKEEYKTCLGDTIHSFKKKFDAGLSPAENETVKGWKKDPRIKVGHNWLKIKKSGGAVITPYIVKVSQTPLAKFTRKPSEYSVAELGIVCGLYGKDNGLICTVYPKLDNLVKVFEVRYQSHAGLYGVVRDVISQIEEAEKSGDLLSLPKCPDYMNDDGECPLFNECNPG